MGKHLHIIWLVLKEKDKILVEEARMEKKWVKKMKTIVLGPPGTGKTYTLLNKVQDYLKNTDPDKIGYFAFTKKAANEAKARAMDKFNYTEDDLPYFRTLHSLAFRKLGINKDKVMQKRHYEDSR